jgi:hypothetical protein
MQVLNVNLLNVNALTQQWNIEKQGGLLHVKARKI